MKGRVLYACFLIALFALYPVSMMPPRAYGSATIWTDKPDYGPNETVTIYGSGFHTNAQVTITITAPSQSVDTIYAWTDGYGYFAAQYQLDGMVGTYLVTATDGANTAMKTFTEGNIGYDLYGYTKSPSPGWTKGALHGYAEDEWVPYKIEFSSSKTGSYTLTVVVRHDYFSGTYYALDDVRNWQMWRNGIPATPTHSTPTSVGSELEWTWTFTINENDDVTLTFEAHIAIGASHWPGASIHTEIHDVTAAPPTSISQGNKDVSLPVSGIAPPPAQADIAVQKTGPQYAHEGETISYQFTVRNYGPDTASSVQVIDNKLGDLTGYLPDTTLLNGEINTFTVNYVVPTPSGDITNTVTVSSTTGDPNSANNQASWTVDVLHPGIDVAKSGPNSAHEGDTITYTITVSNPSTDTPMTKVSVIDSLLGDLGASFSATLAPGTSESKTFSYTVPTPSGDITNTVTVEYKDALNTLKTDSASWTVDVLRIEMLVSKSGPYYAYEGETIIYTITVSNPSSDTTIYKVSVIDSLLGDISAHFSASLAPLASESKTFSYTVPTPSGDIINTVTATYKDALGQQKTATASWIVDVLHPSIDVTKTGPNCAHEGDVIIYTITVSNTGDCKLYGVLVTDPTLGFSWTGDINGGGTMSFPVSYTVPSPSTTVCNTVTAYGFDALGLVVSDSASWCVTVLHPAIDVTKSGPLYAHEGDTITYTITVTNTGDCPLYSVSVTDNVLGLIYGNGLALGETKTFTVSYTVPTPSGDITNTVTASGYDAQGKKVTDTASWFVDVLHPGIDVAKSGPDSAHEGDTITYTITVSNTGDCELYSVSVTDNVLGLIYGNGLALGETKTFTVSYTVPTPSLDVTNTVTASGYDALGSLQVSDTASWTVDVLHPGIDVTKSGPNNAHEGDIITYTITVFNPSTDTTMYKVSVIDSLLGDISGSFSDSLGPLASETKTFIYTVPTPSENILNTVITTYKNGLNLPLIDDDSWTVTVLHPDISVSKSGPDSAHEGDTITYTITVSNTGDCELYSVSVTDNVLGLIYGNGLALGETKTFTVSYTIPTPSGDVTNTVTASGSDALGLGVSDSASWTVKVQYQITVTATPPGAIGGTFTVEYTQCGITYTIVQVTTWTDWADSGTTVTVTNPQDPINVGPGTRYRFDHYDPSPSVTMTESKTIILVYVTQYYLTVKTFPHVLVPQPTGIPKNPPSDWYDEGTQVTLTASPTGTAYNTQYWFTWWEVYQLDGQVIRRNPITVIMNSPTTATASYCDIDPKDPLGDVNLDGKVDMTDLVTIARHFGAKRGEANYNFAFDVDRDGRIDLYDLAAAARNLHA